MEERTYDQIQKSHDWGGCDWYLIIKVLCESFLELRYVACNGLSNLLHVFIIEERLRQ